MSSKELSIHTWKAPQSPPGSLGAELGAAELDLAMGGTAMKTPTWKYVDGTPDWAIANALLMGYEVEHLG